MPDTATAPTATNAQTRAAGTRMLGYYLGGGGAKVDALIDLAIFLMKNADGLFYADADTLIDAEKSFFFFSPNYGLGTPDSDGLQLFCDPASAIRFGARTGGGFTERARLTGAGHFGLGVSPSVPFHVKTTGEIIRLETTTARGRGGAYFAFYDPTGRKAVIGFANANDGIDRRALTFE